AEKLNIPQICYIEDVIKLEKGKITAKRAIEGGYEVLEAPTPSLLTVIDSNIPRPQNAMRIMKFKKAKTKSELIKANSTYTDANERAAEEKRLEDKDLLIYEWSAEDVGADKERIGFAGSPTKVKEIMSVVLTATDTKKVEASEKGISSLI